jgi:7-keto-8-aminopelargonate synthetase-like enzyme
MSAPNRFRNNSKAIAIGGPAWELALRKKLIGMVVNSDSKTGKLETTDGHSFYNMCSCSYLGLHQHPAILSAARDAIGNHQYLSVSPVRIRLKLFEDLEERLSRAFRGDVIYTTSATYSTLAVLPLLASGHIGDGTPRTIVYDKNCHFSMALTKPICADESTVLTIENNDLNHLETICKEYGRVAYIADGIYSMGGQAALSDLLSLQKRYDLFLYFDDAHAVSIFGDTGEGYIRASVPELNERTIVVGSLCKAFGAAGGFITLRDSKYRSLLERFGGPTGWSQEHMPAVMAAALASAEIHMTEELPRLQRELREKIEIFDNVIKTTDSGSPFPVRVITLGRTEDAMEISKKIFEQGFYVSPVFFPIVAQNQSGIRIMLRADVPASQVLKLAEIIKQELGSRRLGTDNV